MWNNRVILKLTWLEKQKKTWNLHAQYVCISKFCFLKLSVSPVPSYLHVATSEMWCWSGGRGMLMELSLCYSIVYHYNDAQLYKQFLQIGQLEWSGVCIIARWDWPLTWLTNHFPSVLWYMLSTVQQDLRHYHLTLPEAADLSQNRPLWRMMLTYCTIQS